MAKVYLCLAKKDYPFENIEGSTIIQCDHCKQDIWAAPSTLAEREQAFILCKDCCLKMPNLNLGGITDFQMEELQAAMNQSKKHYS